MPVAGGRLPPLPGDDQPSSDSPEAPPPPPPAPASSPPSRPSRIFLRTSWAADLISCIFLRTRVPAALLPPVALATSSAASSTSRLSVSYSCMGPPFGVRYFAKNDTRHRLGCQIREKTQGREFCPAPP